MGGNFVSCVIAAGTAVLLGAVPMANAQTMAVGGRSESAKIALVSVDVVDKPLISVLDAIAKQAGLRTSWNDAVFNLASRVTLRVRDMSADAAFAKALSGTGLRAVITPSFVSIVKDVASAPMAQGSVSGKIIDSKTKQPLRGATVTLDESTKGVLSNDVGGFLVPNVTPGTHTLRIRMLGYVKAAKSVVVADGQTASLTVALEPSASALDQVVVTGTIVATAQRAIPNAMTVITAKDIEQRGITRIDQLFRGDVPGLFVQNFGSGNPFDSVTMFSRGATQLQDVLFTTTAATTPIKTYVDGIELANPSYLSQIDPQSIERIEILTGPQASTIYGSNAINGVMQVFTKRGTTTRPQLTATLLSGLVQNNFRSALTPQHAYATQVNGTEGRWSYNAGGSWDYIGPWTPAKQTARLSGFGGARMQVGAVTTDASIRLATTTNRQSGATAAQASTIVGAETGYLVASSSKGRQAPHTARLQGQTLGLTIGYAPRTWWSNEFVLGSDVSRTEDLTTAPRLLSPTDTLLGIIQNADSRQSLHYSTTAQVELTPFVRTVMTVGADGWQSLHTSMSATPSTLTGTLANPSLLTRVPSHNSGAFFQGQLSLGDALFITYGIRGEWNPNYGADAQPNVAPRYGIAYTRDWGPLTAKLRASYGRSTRPPLADQKTALALSELSSAYVEEYGPIDYFLASPDLGPEFQQGGEGGLEMYWGHRGSLVITRYNQTVDRLIYDVPGIDSARSLISDPSGYDVLDPSGYGWVYQHQYLNVGSIRNQGWELQGTANAGPLSARGTYSWTKSRMTGITPAYRALLTGVQFVPGASFSFLPEHTWALGITYSHQATTLALNLNGTGYMILRSDWLVGAASPTVRLLTDRPRTATPDGYISTGPGYIVSDLNATHRFSSNFEGVLQVQNLTNVYHNDFGSGYATMGRQTMVGLRLHL